MLVPHASGYASGLNIPSFHVPQYHPIPTTTPGTSTPAPPPKTAFRAPAHKHAHHLHSIPPREKSTRTLIIDHMLWVHGRTRFAQARAELGMTDRTGGPSSPYYAHRRRPENYDEEADENSEGEDVVTLKARAGDPHNPHETDEDGWMKSQDLSLARTLRLRAEGLEKVVTSMLGQLPPTVHPIDDEELTTPPSSPRIPANKTHHLHTLPNGVRLRLALGTIINDLFARQAPPPPYRQQLKAKTPTDRSPSESSSIAFFSHLPVALASLYTVCAANSSTSNSIPAGSSSPFPSFSPPSAHKHHLPTPSTRTRSLYSAGADPTTANSPPSLRCPRHLHTGCQICVEAKTPIPGIQSRGRSNSFMDYRTGQGGFWQGLPGGGGIAGWQDGSGVGSGLLRPGVRGSCLRRKCTTVEESGTALGSGNGNTKLSELIPRFIRLSALVAVEMALEAKDATEDVGQDASSGVTRDGPEQFSISDQEWAQMQQRQGGFPSLPLLASPTMAGAAIQSQDGTFDPALPPTREWYLLLCGLLTRAALEGYLTAGWRGSQAVECLLTLGLGMPDSGPPGEEEQDEFEEFDPDGLPTLREAMRLLFPMVLSPHRKGRAEEEYAIEMRERLRRFYDIPASTPDLSTHMEDLAWQYPAEPVERAAVRFCEAIARWRGKPELESYKKPTPTSYQYSQNSIPGITSSLPMNSLVHSNPPTPTLSHPHAPSQSRPSSHSRRPRRKPSIDIYFSQPSSSFQDTSWNPNKRRRTSDATRPGPSKRPNLG